MDRFEISVRRFNDFASEFAERFMNIDTYQVHFDKFCELITTGKPSLLELGCGPGNVTKYLKQRFPDSEIVAIDLAPRMIDIARSHLSGVDFRIMDVRDIMALGLQFDAIMCSFCLPFLSKVDTQKLISDCSEKLIKDGILFLSTMEGDESKAGFEPTCFSGDLKVYFNYHQHDELERALLDNGFTVIYDVRQDYREPDGSITIDLIMIAKKK